MRSTCGTSEVRIKLGLEPQYLIERWRARRAPGKHPPTHESVVLRLGGPIVGLTLTSLDGAAPAHSTKAFGAPDHMRHVGVQHSPRHGEREADVGVPVGARLSPDSVCCVHDFRCPTLVVLYNMWPFTQ